MHLKNILVMLVSVGLIISPVYAQKDKDKAKVLPQGLQKKVARGKPLPPGWQKKLIVGHRLETDIVKQGDIVVPLDSKGLLTIRLEGKLVRLVKATREIVEILE